MASINVREYDPQADRQNLWVKTKFSKAETKSSKELSEILE